MRKHYDFSKARRNPYAKRLKKQVTLRIDEPTLAYFKNLGERTGMPYQTLINMYLRDCAEHRKELRVEWRSTNAPNKAVLKYPLESDGDRASK